MPSTTRLVIAQRQELFRLLVELQDAGHGVDQSREMAADRFGVSEGYALQIEEEGIRKEWPPLDAI